MPRLLEHEMFEPLRRWTGAQMAARDVPLEATIAAMDEAVHTARGHLAEERWDTLDLVRELLLGREAGSAGLNTRFRDDQHLPWQT